MQQGPVTNLHYAGDAIRKLPSGIAPGFGSAGVSFRQAPHPKQREKLNRRAATGYERDEKQDDEHEEQDLGDFRGQACDAHESKHARDQGDDQECNSIT